MAPIRVFVVDDSATMRAIIKARLKSDPGIEVVGEAADPIAARAGIRELSPDVITLDIEMPKMTGLEFLDKIMRLRPTPVIMISSITQRGAAMSVDALARGAVDCIGKPTTSDFNEAFAELPGKVRAAAKAKIQKSCAPVTATSRGVSYQPNDKIVFIGASTGGVEALMTVLTAFPKNCPPTVIVQHMPSGFTSSFASRLNTACAPEVREASDNAPLKPGVIYLAPGGDKHLEVVGGVHPKCRLRSGDLVSGHKPSVDVLFRSATKLRAKIVGVLLTGMGKDGAEGLLEIRKKGGETVAQNEKTSVVYGMPRVAYELGAVERRLALPHIPRHVLSLCQGGEKSAA